MITVPENILVQIEARLASGEYASVEELLQHALDALDRQRTTDAWLVKQLDEAIDEGPMEEMTKQDWDDIRREGVEEILRRKRG